MSESPRERWERNYREGEEARQALVAYLTARGHEVDAPEQEIAPTWESRFNYSDKGDINVRLGGWVRVEVKRMMGWDAVAHETLPWPKAIIGKPHRLLREIKGTYPLSGVALLSANLTRLLYIPATSRHLWYQASGVSTRNPQQRNTDDAVCIKIADVDARWYRWINGRHATA